MARSNNGVCGRGSERTVVVIRRCDAAVASRGKAMSQQSESIGVGNDDSVQQRSNGDSTGNSNGTATGTIASSNTRNSNTQAEGTAD